MESTFITSAIKIWNKISIGEKLAEVQLELDIHKKLLNIFQVGESYFYIFDVENLEFNYKSPEMEQVLGYPLDTLNIPFLMDKIHPEDQPWFLNIEGKVIEFFGGLTLEQIPNYKVRYDYRIKKADGAYIRILHQVVTLQYCDTGRIIKTFGAHTDISHLKMEGIPVLSFVGLNGEPSYINVDIKKEFRVSSEFLTKREREILSLMVDGKKTKEIAEVLYISEATVSTHRKNLLFKTKAKNTSEMVVMAIMKGWV